MQLIDRRFRHNDSVESSFGKSLSSKSSLMLALVEEACDELIDKVFNEKFSRSVQDLAGRKVTNELSAHCVPCDAHQWDEVGISAVGELARSKDNFEIKTFSMAWI